MANPACGSSTEVGALMVRRRSMGAVALPALLMVGLIAGPATAADSAVVVGGLNNPRGIDIGANGRVVVAEAGAGRVVRITPGKATPIAVGLPTVTSPEGEATGPTNVALTGSGNVFVVVGGGPTDVDARFATLRRITGVRRQVADIAAFQVRNPDPEDQDGIPEESNPYGLESIGAGRMLVADAAGNDLLLVRPNGRVVNVARIPLHTVSTSHLPPDAFPFPLPPQVTAEAVPTSVAVGPDGYWYVAELTGFPFTPGASRIWRISPQARGATCDADTSDGCSLFADGFTAVTGIDFGPDGSLYVVEMARHGLAAFFMGGDTAGALWRVKGGARTELAAGELTVPADVAVARNGTVYVTNKSVFPDGEVLAIAP